MINKLLNQRIAERAYAIWEYRIANNIPGSDLGDWEEAESEIIPDRRNEGCPLCGCKLLARNDGEIFCLDARCNFRVKAKRLNDKDTPDFRILKKVWS
jgi:hypothetical protein